MTSSSYTAFPLVNAHTHRPTEPHVFVLQRWAGDPVVSGQHCSVGIHPGDAAKGPELLQTLERKLALPEVVAVGETGLDSRIDISAERQESVYAAQLRLAEKYGKPVILHCVGSWDRCRALHERHAKGRFLVYHGFSKPKILARVLAYPPAIISIGARLLHSGPLREAVREIPPDRLLLETDDDEIDLMLLYKELAAIKSLPLPAVTDQLYTNFRTVFGHDKLA